MPGFEKCRVLSMSVTVEKDLTVVRLPAGFAPEIVDAIKAAILSNRSPGAGRVHLIVPTAAADITMDLGLKTVPPTPKLSAAITAVMLGSSERKAS